MEDFADDADGEDHTSKQQQSGLPPRRQQEDATERRRASLERSIDAALAPLRDAFLAEVERELLALMFPAMDDFEAALPTKQDVTRALGNLRARNTTFASLFDAVERAMPSSEVRWRASAVDERDAQIGALCATLRASLQTHLVGVSRRSTWRRWTASPRTSASPPSTPSRTASRPSSRVLSSFSTAKTNTTSARTASCALWRPLGTAAWATAQPCRRGAAPSSTRRPAAPVSSPAASRGLLLSATSSSAGPSSMTTSASPSPQTPPPSTTSSPPTNPTTALQLYHKSRARRRRRSDARVSLLPRRRGPRRRVSAVGPRQLGGLKRLAYAEGDPAAVLAFGADLVAQRLLRPSSVWLLVLGADCDAPFLVAERQRGGGAALDYVAWLVAGPEDAAHDPTTPLRGLDRETDAWRDVQRSLDAYARRAAEGGTAYDALDAHGPALLATYKGPLSSSSSSSASSELVAR